jgi:hypothetical protein
MMPKPFRDIPGGLRKISASGPSERTAVAGSGIRGFDRLDSVVLRCSDRLRVGHYG